MRVSSAPGQGTTFALYLPLREAERRSASPAPAGHGEPVLVVVEETGLMLMLRDTIESHGYRVLTAQGGFAAVQSLYEQGLPAAVVMEAKMNLMTGVHTATALIERDFRGPVVMLAREGNVDREDLPPLPRIRVITKPVNPAELLGVLAEELGKAPQSVVESTGA